MAHTARRPASVELPGAPHATPVDEVLAGLHVNADIGLSDAEATRRRGVHGRNELGDGGGIGWLRLLWGQLASAVVVLLLGAGIVGFIVGEVIEAVAILVVLIVNAIVGFATELQAARSMAALRQLMGTVAEVERGDRRDEIDAAELVPGDIVGIEAGEQVPADLRLIEAEGLQVEEAGLTGESDAVTKTVEPVSEAAPLGDRTNMVFMGTTVLAGRGRGVVVATGRRTQMGRIADLAGSAEQTQAPLQRGLDQLSRRLAIGVVVGASALFGLGLVRGREVAEMAEIAVALAIAVVPEGLPAVATLTLAVGMRRMAAGNALVRRLPAVETLGSTTVVCSDKTGTLTRNEMEVVDLVLADGADHDVLWRSRCCATTRTSTVMAIRSETPPRSPCSMAPPRTGSDGGNYARRPRGNGRRHSAPRHTYGRGHRRSRARQGCPRGAARRRCSSDARGGHRAAVRSGAAHPGHGPWARSQRRGG
jgi:P-type Ca2+ transporter type 2C